MAAWIRIWSGRGVGVLLALALAGCAPEMGLLRPLPVIRASGEEIQPASPPSPPPQSAFGNALTYVRMTSAPSDASAAGAIFRAAAPTPPALIETPPWMQPAKSSSSNAVDLLAGDDDDAKKNSDSSPDAAPAKEKQPEVPPWLSVHEQGTVVIQRHPTFTSPYVGPRSLLPVEPGAVTETGTLYLDARLWRGAEIVFDPEIAGGRGLSGAQGIAGFTNGEATRVGLVEPTPYIARLYFRQTWGLGGEWEKVEDGANQLSGPRDIDRISITVGKMSATDQFDNNAYSHDPRTQFMNWSLMYNGAWDYPANTRGYTIGATAEIYTVWWAARYGIFAEPTFANGPQFDHFDRAAGEIWEVEEHWGMDALPGKLHEFVFMNLAAMGNYDEAVAMNPAHPDVDLTRAYRMKYGFGTNLEQQLAKNLGCFVKASWNDGHTEDWAFTEIDRSASAGLLLKGARWDRPNDTVGLAGVINGLSGPHRSYLEHGGIGFIIGDGKLNYEPEQIIEAFYNLQITKGINVSADVQGINNPAYNADRGPVAVFSLRVHVEH